MRVCVAVSVVELYCGVWDEDDERKGQGETQCRLIACSSQKAPRGPPGLTSPSNGRIAINSIICLLDIQYITGGCVKCVKSFRVKLEKSQLKSLTYVSKYTTHYLCLYGQFEVFLSTQL